MKTALSVIFCLFSLYSSAQKTADTTSSFLITGKVKQEKLITLGELRLLNTSELKNVNTSCSPKKEERIKEAKVVLLKDVLDSVKFDYEKGVQLNAFYFVLTASDGYKLVYSYNEIFNTETGRNLYIAIELNGRPVNELPNSLLVLTTSDIKGGRRNMKWLKEIKVCRAE
jgi:hypothetical protein